MRSASDKHVLFLVIVAKTWALGEKVSESAAKQHARTIGRMSERDVRVGEKQFRIVYHIFKSMARRQLAKPFYA